MSVTRHQPAIPLSPPSPPGPGHKEESKLHFIEDIPRSPASPPLMSVATKSYASSFANTQSSPDSAMSQQSFSPPTSISAASQDHHKSSPLTSDSSQIPNSANSESKRAITMEDQDEHRNKRQKVEIDGTSNEESMETDVTTTPTNHDRQEEKLVELLPHNEESNERSGENNQTEDVLVQGNAGSNNASPEMPESDVDDTFLLCKQALPRSRPTPSHHLLSLYGLSPLHATVARTDPVTGEKINKLRKSYEGKIKEFALAGRNKPVKLDFPEGGKGNLRSLMEDIPEEQWLAETAGKKIEINPEFKTTLEKAMEMRPGAVRNNEAWEEILGHEKPRPVTAIDIPIKKVLAPPVNPTIQPNGVSRPQIPGGADIVRPRRTGKKRSYADNSFEGYGDGYVDDDGEMEAATYSNSEEGGGGPGRKKRKKEHSFSVSPTTYERPSYGVGGYVDSR